MSKPSLPSKLAGAPNAGRVPESSARVALGWTAQSGRYTRGPEEEDARRMSVAAPPATASETEPLDALARDIEGRRIDPIVPTARRVADARRRGSRTETVICVVGEFKNGKSALINALLGSSVCPVDDDLATSAVTVVRYGDPASAEVHRREAGSVVVETIEPVAIADWAQETSDREVAATSISSTSASRARSSRRSDAGRHARGRWLERRPRCRDAGIPAVGRRPRLRDRCLG